MSVNITAKEVNALRSMTGAGMMDCKKALVDAQGDKKVAVEILRKKGQKVSAARSGKATTEGSVFIKLSKDQTRGVLIALNCETDFVAKNADFQNLGKAIVSAACEQKTTSVVVLKQIKIGSLTIEEKITEFIGKVGEKIEISECIYSEGEVLCAYVHAGGKIGVLVALRGGNSEEVITAGRNIGMQIAAMNPLVVNEKDLNSDMIDKELTIIKEQILAEGKPENMVEKIARGKLKKFYKENVLLCQPYVKDNVETVEQYLSKVSKNASIVRFDRVAVE